MYIHIFGNPSIYLNIYTISTQMGKTGEETSTAQIWKLERKLIKEVTDLIDPRKPIPKQAVGKAKNQPSLQ